MSMEIVSNYYHYKLKAISAEEMPEHAEREFRRILASGYSLEIANKIKKMLLDAASFQQRMSADGEPLEPLKKAKKPHTCNRLAQISDKLWEELISNYDMENLDYDDRRALAEDFEKQGLISAEERDQLLAQFDRIEENKKSPKPLTPLEYDKEKYPTIYDYLRDNVKDASPEASAAMRESMVVRNKFEHYIEHMKAYRPSNL